MVPNIRNIEFILKKTRTEGDKSVQGGHDDGDVLQLWLSIEERVFYMEHQHLLPIQDDGFDIPNLLVHV